MLVVLSDLHLTDRTSGVQAVCADTYERMFKMLRDRAEAIGATEVTILYLGDIFDMIRTTTWFDAEGVRPWDQEGEPDSRGRNRLRPEVLTAARRVLLQISGAPVPRFEGQMEFAEDHVLRAQVAGKLKERDKARIKENRKIIRLLRNPDLGSVEGRPRKVVNLYVPGNHDRILNCDPVLRRMVRKILNIQDGRALEDEFLTTQELPEYGVFARHGHEWDEMSFVTARRVSTRQHLGINPGEYAKPPLSELMALEFSSKLPPTVRNELIKSGEKVEDAMAVEERLSELDDVRPTHAIFAWILHQVRGTRAEAVTRKAMRDLAEAILRHEFYRGCANRPLHLRLLLWTMRHLWVPGLLPLLRWVGELSGILVQNHMRCAGRREVRLLKNEKSGDEARYPWLRYFLVGHTHLPAQWPASRLKGSESDVLYVNTGTLRPYHYQALDHGGFCRIETLTCTLAFQDEVDLNHKSGGPTLEQWSWQAAKKPEPPLPSSLEQVGTGLGNRLRSMLESAQSQFTSRRPLDRTPKRR